MGKLSTHVLDTSCGKPAAGMRVTLYRQQPDASWLVLTKAITNQDGRVDHPLLEGASLQAGRYCLRFEAGQYFDKQRALLGQSIDAMVASGVASIESSAAKAELDMAQLAASTDGVHRFLDQIPIEFGITDPKQSYHVPLLVTPWSYATYRGS
jgi:5-hydroxyisourate hydrolase